MQLLKFSKANAKIQALATYGKVYSFDLPAGKTCPFADTCKSEVVRIGGKSAIKDGPNCQVRCFSASQEVLYTRVYKARKYNFDMLKKVNSSVDKMAELIQLSLPPKAGIIRIHVSGDMFSQNYFLAWLKVARNNPNILFYAYTKALPYWIINKKYIPHNMVLTASRGGKFDNLIELHNLRNVTIVNTPEEGDALGLPIDHTEEYAADPQKRDTNFALLLHGVQPKGSPSAEALKVLKKRGVQFSYNRGAK